MIGCGKHELISDRKFEIWLDEFKKCKDSTRMPSSRSIMEEYNRDAWCEIVERCRCRG